MSDHDPEPTIGPIPFVGRTHAEVLAMRFDDTPSELVAGLIPRGVLVTIAGLPETYKGWVATKLAAIVAAGTGAVLGCDAVAQGAAGYFWNDDSTRNEAERVQLFARVHDTPAELPLTWFLNEDVSLPRDIDRLRETIARHAFALVVLDSVYNFTAGLDLKDRDVGALYARLKAEVCDPTGCTIALVDHMPWKTDANRSRQRSYGDVFKNAATRAGIYIDADGQKLYVEARGNSIRGFKRSPAYWDPDALELRLVDTTRQDEADAEHDEKVLAWLIDHPGEHTTTAVRAGVGGNGTTVDKALERLRASDRVRDPGQDVQTDPGQKIIRHRWIASIHADSALSLLDGTGPDRTPSERPEEGASVRPSLPRRGDRRAPDRQAVRVSPVDEGPAAAGVGVSSGNGAEVSRDAAREVL